MQFSMLASTHVWPRVSLQPLRAVVVIPTVRTCYAEHFAAASAPLALPLAALLLQFNMLVRKKHAKQDRIHRKTAARHAL